MHKSKFVPTGLYRCETWSLVLNEEHRRRDFEKRVQRRTLAPKGQEVTKKMEENIMRSFVHCRPHIHYGDQILEDEMGGP
jgi:hypothetical protein